MEHPLPNIVVLTDKYMVLILAVSSKPESEEL